MMLSHRVRSAGANRGLSPCKVHTISPVKKMELSAFTSPGVAAQARRVGNIPA
jgi:hypothetical protein